MRNAAVLLCFLFAFLTAAGQSKVLALNKEYSNIELKRKNVLYYDFNLTEGGIYQFSILQQGIAVYYVLTGPDNREVFESNYPEDITGYEKFEHAALVSGTFHLQIKRFEDPENADSGRISIIIKSLNKTEVARRNKIKKELEPENKKNVLTLDIDHFWEAFDYLKNCKTFLDSVKSFQTFYIDRATNGLLDFILARDLTAEKYVQAVSLYAAHYQAVRPNTYQAKKAEPVIEQVFARFRELYPNFKPFKVCFAIGINNTGGTTSSDFVLIGTEITTATEGNIPATDDAIIQKIKSIVAHECVHTQQKLHASAQAIHCELLYKSLQEGSCDFIGELVSGNKKLFEYGDQHEGELWTQFKNELCNQNIGNWLYNGYAVKDKPADLGYYIGYKIAESYYNNAKDKKQAIIDIIEMEDPIRFLELSKYDQKPKSQAPDK
jgi:hypothetical protein